MNYIFIYNFLELLIVSNLARGGSGLGGETLSTLLANLGLRTLKRKGKNINY
jgi:hypothetical protein